MEMWTLLIVVTAAAILLLAGLQTAIWYYRFLLSRAVGRAQYDLLLRLAENRQQDHSSNYGPMWFVAGGAAAGVMMFLLV